MNELTIYSRIDAIKDELNNANDEDKDNFLEAINEIFKEIMNLPIMQEYTELVKLYENKFDTCLLANVGDNKR